MANRSFLIVATRTLCNDGQPEIRHQIAVRATGIYFSFHPLEPSG
jgi:hypothetical protein